MTRARGRGIRVLPCLALLLPLYAQKPQSQAGLPPQANPATEMPQEVLDDLAAALKANPGYKVTLWGEVDLQGDPADQKRAALARVGLVKQYLENKGVSPSQIAVDLAAAGHEKAGLARIPYISVLYEIAGSGGRSLGQGSWIGGSFGGLTGRKPPAGERQGERAAPPVAGERREARAMPPPPPAPVISPLSGHSDWTGGFTGRALLVGKETEDKRYGLFSYLLIPRQPADGEADLKKRYLAALSAYQSIVDSVTSLLALPVPPALDQINVTYLPLREKPDKITAETLLEANNSALAKTLVHLLEARHRGIEGRDGPFIVSSARPLIGADAVGAHLFIDMSRVPADAAALYMRAFLTQASHERYWEAGRDRWILDCYSFIENAGEEFARVAPEYKEKGFLATIFNWFK